MKGKGFFMALIAAVCLLATSLAIAEDVFVTKYGKKYHPEGSRFIQNKEVIKMTREEAEAKGYSPSKEFFKKDAASEEKPAAETSK